MERDNRYAAFLILSLIFLGVFSFNQTRQLRRLIHKEDAGSGLISPVTLQAVLSTDKIVAPRSRSREVFAGDTGFPGFPIDINRATADELMVIPGVGKKTAARIIEKRLEIGGFKDVNDLTEVQRIGKVKIERIRRYVTVGAAVPAGG